MIINIPLQFDESAFEGKISEDIQDKVIKNISDSIAKALKEKGRSYAGYYSASVEDGVLCIASNIIEDTIKEYQDKIIELASDKLANKLALRKAAKDLIKE